MKTLKAEGIQHGVSRPHLCAVQYVFDGPVGLHARLNQHPLIEQPARLPRGDRHDGFHGARSSHSGI